MAIGRRGGPPDFKSTLGAFFRSTLEQAAAVKDVVEQQTRSRGGLIDQALTQRKRTAILARLGEEVYELGMRGLLGELALDPSIGGLIEEVNQLAESPPWGGHDGDGFEVRRKETGTEAVASADYRGPSQSDHDSEYRVWRPSVEDAPPFAEERETNEAAFPKKDSASSSRGTSKGSAGTRFAKQGADESSEDSEEDLEDYMHQDDVPGS